MLRLLMTILFFALIAGLFGFTQIAGYTAGIVQITLFIYVIIKTVDFFNKRLTA